MSWIDWAIVLVPVFFVYYLGWYSRRFITGVSDYLAAGRLCGRYLLTVSDLANALSIIGLTAYVEVNYKTGFALSFWSQILIPLAIITGLAGYCTYRFRETKAMSLGQFLEMRYSRKFRIFAAALRSLSEILANMIMPALAARFFIYFLDLPRSFSLCGITIPTFMFIVLLTLVMAISLICMGGTLALVITDTFQGLICYPLLAIFIIFILTKFSWSQEILPVMSDRIAGESFINPMDVSELREFNFFSVVVLGVVVSLMHRASWTGAGTASAARSPQEQKMAGLLGNWRGAISSTFYVLIAITIITMLNHVDFSKDAHQIRTALGERVLNEIVVSDKLQERVMTDLSKVTPPQHIIGVDTPLSQASNNDTPYLDAVHQSLLTNVKDSGEANATFQKFRTLFYQLNMAMTMRHLLPTGLLGMFCLLMILAMVSTDDTRIYSAALTVAQDVVLPLRKKELTMEQHIWMLRWISIGVGVIFFFGSYFMAQMNYINLYVALVTNMWLGGCGPVMIFGLYSKFGTTQGAWTSLLVGMFMAILGVYLDRNWADTIYPWIASNGWVEAWDSVLITCSAPFDPWIKWRMDAVKFPINSYEFYFMNMMLTLVLYIVVSLLTKKEDFNLERMLHRGKYSLDGARNIKQDWSPRGIFKSLVGITPEYTKADRAISYAVFFYSFVYVFFLTFVLVAILNAVGVWQKTWWGNYFLVVYLVVPCAIAMVTAVWFGVGGLVDMKRLFHDLRNRVANPLDDGRVSGNMSLADKAQLEAIDRESAGKDEQK